MSMTVSKPPSILVQLWKYNYSSKVLENYYNDWNYYYNDWNYLPTKWSVPSEGALGTIENIESFKVLESQGKHSSVILNNLRNDSLKQKWRRGKTTKNGYFTLKNEENGAYLTNELMVDNVLGRTDYFTHTIVAGKYLYQF